MRRILVFTYQRITTPSTSVVLKLTNMVVDRTYIPRITGKLCPFAAMATYLREREQTIQTAPLFMFTYAKPLLRNSCLKHLRSALKKLGYNLNTHSFRIAIGATTSASHMLAFLPVLSRWLADGEVRPIRDIHAHTDMRSKLQPPNLPTWHRPNFK